MTTTPPGGPRIAQVGAVSLGTPDLEKSLHFFRDLLGMEEVERIGDTSYLRGYQELKHHSLVLFSSAEAVVDSYSFRVARPQDVELFHQQLIAQEVEAVELPSGHQAGRGTATRFLLPHSEHPFELYYDIDAPQAPEEIRSKLPSNSSRRRGLGVRRIDHFNVQAAPEHLGAAEGWLRESFGFKRREFVHVPEANNMLVASWLSVTPQVHDLAIAVSADGKNAQMHHVAFNLENHSDVLVAADVLRDHDVTFDLGPGKHGVSQAMYLYLRDPGSGHRVELYAGSYHIFDPDWKALEWTPAMEWGATWYGDPLEIGPDSSMMSSTNSSPLASVLEKGTAKS
ncbi:VOC family protein [Kineosporia mesophila]|uniref:VOC family protein n=1 Tax=Kineosporia mesophila TaxID=566012 RepID=A0ABP6ZNP6_9ACTN|nr:VOC family protein [Kineosporia mesophila]MCD5354469.1 VOC family protein [Kineosporia mesophila]